MSRDKQKVLLGLCLFILMLTGYFILRSDKPQGAKDTQFIMDTIMEITAYGPQAETAIDAAFAEIKRIDKLMNIYDPDSEAAKINAMAGKEPVPVSEDMLYVLEKSRYYSEITGGAFDITIGPLTTLWGIGKKGDYIPDTEAIEQAKALVNYRNIEINKENRTVFLTKPGMMLDLGSVGKGYAVNRAVEVLNQHQIKSALINAGGSIRVIGPRPDGQPWRVGVQHPRNSEGIIAKLALTQWNVLDTSGDYQRFFIKDGVRYHHILDPKTGWPAYGHASNTIAMNSSMEADILNTALFILDIDTGRRIIESFPGADAIWVSENEEVVITPGFDGKIEITPAEK